MIIRSRQFNPIKLVSAFCLTTILIGCGDSSPRSNESGAIHNDNIVASTEVESPSIKLFDINATNLEPYFRGVNVKDIVKLFKSHETELAIPEKSEFETTEQYNKRVSEAKLPVSILQGIVSDVASNNYYLAVTDEFPQFSLTYIADEQKLYLDPPTHVFEATETKSTNQTQMSNAYGVVVNVDEETRDVYKLDWVTGVLEDKSLQFGPSEKYEITIPPDQAQKWKDIAEVVFVCKLIKPWYRVSNSSQTPTLERPKSVRDTNYTVPVKIEQIWIIDRYTGNVLHKWH